MKLEEETQTLRAELDRVLSALDSGSVSYFPIRHHSPACAWQVRECIRELKPAAILVEGPANFTPLIPHLLHEDTEPPVAIYTTAVRNSEKKGKDESFAKGDRGRFGAYFPFCAYSPEYVALKAGAELGAHLEFIDLSYPEQVEANHAEDQQPRTARVENLLRDQYLQRSAYLKALAQRCGCRDFHELWDHLFEARCFEVDQQNFRRIVATYCFLARKHESAEAMLQEGTLARERRMGEAIARAKLKFGHRAILVVTGGFHTVALPFQELAAKKEKEAVSISEELAPVLIRYSYPQLDGLSGYGAGMPSPSYYGDLWRGMQEGQAQAWAKTSLEILARLGGLSREQKGTNLLSTADVQAAWLQACGVASLRSHPGPLREDLRDGIRAAFIKGAQDVEGRAMLKWVDEILVGTESGRVTAQAVVPPILKDFQRLAARHKFDCTGGKKREVALDFYRKAEHRESSRFLHQVRFLSVPFATFQKGPDFATGTGHARLIEHWDYRWTPQSDSGVIDCSLYGSSLMEAAGNKIEEEAKVAVAQRKSGDAVRLLIRACQMGLHERTASLHDDLRQLLVQEGVFAAAVDAAQQLQLLWVAREPLEASRLKDLPALFRCVLERCAYLVAGLNDAGDAEQRINARALIGLADLFDQSDLPMTRETLVNALQQFLPRSNQFPCLTGAVLGVLFRWALVEEEEVIRTVCGFLVAGSSGTHKNLGILEGLFLGSRHLAWQSKELLERINTLMSGWSEMEFLKLLPDLRLAFAALTPREVGETANMVAQLHGEKTLGPLVMRESNEAELLRNARLTARVLEQLKRDSLATYLHELGVTP